MDLVPVVDIVHPEATSLAALDRACRDHGFFLVTNHGLDDVIVRTFDAARRFFDAEPSMKGSVRRDAANPLGYNERELTKRRRDHKEVFDFVDPVHGRARHYNRWPDEAQPEAVGLRGFQQAMADHYDACSALADRTTMLVFAALGVDEHTATAHRGDRTTSNMRLNQYTLGDPVPEGERDGLADLGGNALGEHTDLGLLTLLIQDDVGGLQAASTEHGWIDVEPRPGTIVVNLADCLQVMSNDTYRAALHRVLPMTVSTRMSIPYFLNPPRDAIVEPIPGIGDTVRYQSFPFREFIDARSADNYADAGADDAQISRYRVANV